ncbi:T9SS type A sorting domain-containing protein [Hymenobacter busanensis]|uniref:T9SS type A sorting domain-containing protein n=1 Tax=Hymenobacter busanensis TaxID=2607656 RepID=A0A7L4ZYN9_9BACT|nr:T9SS type A sorting domain-containing protein [Hymenobacter busanensis]KAA9333356.1 T9SS type A sorting domain-containing protein [Hymenobacter busanensis]QHJ07965.1 T9SS type A sorting domain-containing protein [Hymenobacter busanensis]
MKHLFSLLLLLLPLALRAQTVAVLESAGWLESAYVRWQPVATAQSYNVYYSGAGVVDQKLDNQLIRNYGSYYRADALGLAPGTYTLKIVPVVAGVEGTATVTSSLSVLAQDRTGFAFSNGRVPGAYNTNGTVKSNAVILYITQNSKNTVSLNVTGATTNPCVGLQTILDGFKKGRDARPLLIRLVGQITDPSYLLSGDLVIENNNFASSSITLEGVGNDAVADGWGIRIKNASNVEIRNIGTMNCDSDEGDNIGLQQDNDYIWVHNSDFFYGHAGSDPDQVKGDGALDAKRSTYVTFSYNHFWDTGKSNLLGLSETSTQGLYITYHHNWYDHSDSRHPRVRFYSAHVYNNYYDGNAKYGAGSTEGSSVFMEGNYFRNCKYPMLTSMQGTDVYNPATQANDYTNMPIFSKEDGGTIKAFDNYMNGQQRFVPYGAAGYPNSTADFDAYVVATRAQVVPSTVVSAYGRNSYNNFDTNPAVMYTYTADGPAAAQAKVMLYAGRVKGGDFQWTFNNAVDDASSAINTPLQTALVNYQTGLVSVQGDAPATGGGGGGTGGGGGSTSGMVHNFTASGTTSTFYTITGNLSTSQGTVVYNGLNLTQCLKLESSTNIAFTTTAAATLTLVFNDAFSGTVRIDGTNQTVSGGRFTMSLPAGAHQIAKGTTANLYYLSTAYAPLATRQPQDELALNVYPNPAAGQVLVAWKSKQVFSLYTVAGRLVKTGFTNQPIDLQDVKPGVYLIRMQDEAGYLRTGRLLKQ